MHSEPIHLQSVALGGPRISVLAFLPPSALSWSEADLAELRESGVSAAVATDPAVFEHLAPWAHDLGLPLVWGGAQAPDGSWKPQGLAGFSRPAVSPSVPYFLISNEPVPGCCFLDTGLQLARYPGWAASLALPWGMALGLKGESPESWRSLALAGVTAGAQLILAAVDHPRDLEPLNSGLRAFSAVLGRELTRIPRRSAQAEAQIVVLGQRVRAAFQGEHGAYSEMAVFSVFDPKTTEAVPTKTFREVYSAVLSGEVDYGVLPIENALAGPIQDNFDLIREFSDLHIVGETQVRIEHNLIGLPSAGIDQVRKVLSHPQGLAQSRVFLESHPDWEQVPFYDTAGSVAHIARQGDPGLAAVASAEAARFYGMKILVPGIETNRQNFTRFFVLAPLVHRPLAAPNKASILFSTADEPGALSRCLAVFAAHGVNMKKLESRPIHGRPWEYLFYVDVQMTENQADFEAAFHELETVSKECRLLGVYRA